jgi:hypothetical protein
MGPPVTVSNRTVTLTHCTISRLRDRAKAWLFPPRTTAATSGPTGRRSHLQRRLTRDESTASWFKALLRRDHCADNGVMQPERLAPSSPEEEFARRWLKFLGLVFVGVPGVLFLVGVVYQIAVYISLVLFGSSGG